VKHIWNVGRLLPDYTTQHPEDSHLHFRNPLEKYEPISWENWHKHLYVYNSRNWRRMYIAGTVWPHGPGSTECVAPWFPRAVSIKTACLVPT
jgi:hypothetical protein